MTQSGAEPLPAKVDARLRTGDSAPAASSLGLAAFCSLLLVLELAAAAFGLVLGNSVVAIRLPAALAGAATAFVTGKLARALGGGRFAQFTAAAQNKHTSVLYAGALALGLLLRDSTERRIT